MPPISFSSTIGRHVHVGNVSSDDSEYNQSIEIQMDNAPAEYAPEPASPQAADYFPMPDGFHEDNPDQEFQDRPEDTTPAVNTEFPYHHLTYVCYPMRAPDVLRRDFLNPLSNAFLRPGQSREDFPDGLRLIFVNWLKKYDITSETGVSVGLWRTVGPDPLLVVIKRIKGWSGRPRPDGPRSGPNMLWPRTQRIPHTSGAPGEIKFNNLPDPTCRTLEFRFLYNPHLTCLPQTHGFQLNNWPEENVTHFAKFYNGGSVGELIERYKKAGRAIPEAMIWHVVAQVGRAYKFVHTGRTMPDKTQERGSVRGPPEEGEKEREWREREDARAANWVPTAHYDGHSGNIWLHFVTQYERENDQEKCLEHFDDYFPQVILGDFGLALNRESDSYALRVHECPDLPERESWKDKAEFGLTLHHMLLAGLREVSRFTVEAIPENWAVRWARWLNLNYSKTLIDVVKRFSYVAYLCDRMRLVGTTSFAGLTEEEYKKWKDGFALLLGPCNEWFHHTMIDLADKEVDERRRFPDDGVESVRWATGQRMSTMPYQVPNRTKYSKKINRPHIEDPDEKVVAVPLDGRETLRSKARTMYTRKLRRPITGAFFRHPPDPANRVDKDKLWVSRTYRLERIRYRKPRAIKVESNLKGDLRRQQRPFTPPPSPGEVEEIESRMFGPSPWNSRVLQWDREGRGDGDESPTLKDWSRFGANQNGGESESVNIEYSSS